jgi:hypothetical protein
VVAPASNDLSLFVDDRELRRRINPKIGWDRFRAQVREAELRGFPTIHKGWGGRYWPKVKAWLDHENRVNDHEIASKIEDGQENFDAATRKGARPQRRPLSPGTRPPPAVLVREERGAGHHGVS